MDPLGDMAYHPDKEESIPATILSSVGALISALGGAEARLRHVHPAANNRAAVLTSNLVEGQTSALVRCVQTHVRLESQGLGRSIGTCSLHCLLSPDCPAIAFCSCLFRSFPLSVDMQIAHV